MKTFKDTRDREWKIALTFGAAKRVKDLLGVNLLALDAGDPPLLTRLGTDVMLLCDVIFALIKPQADEQNVTDEQFGAALGGEAILNAQAAFYEELVLFSQGLGRTDLAKTIHAQAAMIKKAVALVTDKIDASAERQIAKIESEIETILGDSSTNSPESAESTPTP